MAISKITRDPAEGMIKPLVDYLTKNSEGRKRRSEVLKLLGCGTEYFTCYLCGEIKPKSEFYSSSDFRSVPQVSRVCKSCLREIATPISESTGKRSEATPQSLQEALEYVDKPFLMKNYQKAVEYAIVNGSDKLYDKFM